jgi:hypothetical protein
MLAPLESSCCDVTQERLAGLSGILLGDALLSLLFLVTVLPGIIATLRRALLRFPNDVSSGTLSFILLLVWIVWHRVFLL